MWIIRPYWLIGIMLMAVVPCVAQDFAEVYVIVKHQKSDKYIEGATVIIYPIDKTLITDKKGWVKLGLPYARYRIEVATPVAEKIVKEIDIVTDTTLFFVIEDDYMLLDDVEIEEDLIDERIGENIMSIETIEASQLNRIPVIAGEKDLLKAAAYLPGIQTGSEGSSDLLVRGGTPDQNLYLLDGARLYHSNHLYGFLSSFNPLMISEVDIYKGGFPPQYGGKLSAIVDAKTAPPLYNDFEGEATIGIISSSLKLNIPFIADKVNLMVGGRRSYYDAFVRLFSNANRAELYNFHDLNAKLSTRINNKNEISFSLYMDRDLYHEFDNHRETNEFANIKRKWSNRIFNLRWTGSTGVFDHAFSAYYSGFNTSLSDSKNRTDEFYESTFSSFINDYTVKYKVGAKISEQIRPYVGFEATKLEVLGAGINFRDQNTTMSTSSLPEKNLHEFNIYGGSHFNIENKWKADLGARLSTVYMNSNTIQIFEPRVSLTYNPASDRSVKVSYSKMSQALHKLTNPGLGMPIDIFTPSTESIVPEISHQVALGYIRNFDWLGHRWDINTEAYYKALNNIIEYQDGYSSHVFTSPLAQSQNSLEDIITVGQGISYGAEFFVRKNTGRIGGFVSYTLSRTEHQFDELNGGEFFPARHDIRHNLSVSSTFKMSDKWRLNASWQYKTGQAITLPTQLYRATTFSFYTHQIGTSNTEGSIMYAQTDRNAYRMKAFHVLNISAQKSFEWKKWRGALEFGLYNAYNRKNPYFYYYSSVHQRSEANPDSNEIKNVLKSVSIFPVVPSISFTFEL